MTAEEGADKNPKAFNNKPVLARISVVVAGPLFNFILAFLFAMIIVVQVGHDDPIIYSVAEGSPAQEAGLLPGDRITRIGNRKVTSYRDISLYNFVHPGEPAVIRYDRPAGGCGEYGGAAEKRTVTLTPKYNEEYQAYMLGVTFYGYEKTKGIGELLYYSAYEVKYCIVSTVDSLGMMFTQRLKMDEAVTGPVGIVNMVGETVEEGREAGPWAVVFVISTWILLLSSSLGIMNLLPIPALDGGRLLFLLIELVRGKPIDREKEGMVHLAGMMLLMVFMVFVLYNDIRKLF